MALNSANVRVAVTGTVSVGPVGTTAPTGGNDALNAAFDDLGYVSEDGVTETRDRTSNSLRAWQNGDRVREVVTEANLSYEFTMVETKQETVELYYGGTVNTTTGGIPIVPAKTGGRKAFVIDVVDGDEYIRTYIPEGEVTEVGEQVYQSGEAIGYQVTISAYPTSAVQDAAGDNAAAIKYYSDLIVA